jgi:hypothetical protein
MDKKIKVLKFAFGNLEFDMNTSANVNPRLVAVNILFVVSFFLQTF